MGVSKIDILRGLRAPSGDQVLTQDVIDDVNTLRVKPLITGGNNNTFVNTTVIGNTGNNNTAVGEGALSLNVAGNNSTALGRDAGGNAIQAGCLYLGRGAGQNNLLNNRLYINNNNSATPLIYGNFGSGQVEINSRLRVNGNGVNPPLELRDSLGVDVLQVDFNGAIRQNGGIIIRSSDITTGGTNNAWFGENSGDSLFVTASTSLFGEGAGQNNEGNNVAAFGRRALRFNTSANNTAFGSQAGEDHLTGTFNTFIGRQGFANHTAGQQNTALGAQAGQNNLTGIRNVFLGFRAGRNETGSDLLYIHNSPSTTPLIFGNMSANNELILINGRLRITDNTATAVAGDMRYNAGTSTHQGFNGTIWNNLY